MKQTKKLSIAEYQSKTFYNKQEDIQKLANKECLSWYNREIIPMPKFTPSPKIKLTDTIRYMLKQMVV